MKSIISDNPEYENEVSSITTAIEGIQKDRLILSLADYDASYTKINEQKKIIDEKIAMLKSQATELDYDRTLKIIALLEDHFKIIISMVDINRGAQLTDYAKELRREVKELKNRYSQKNIKEFNARLTEMYLKSNVQNVSHLNEDRKEEQFSLSFDPFSQVLVATHKIGDILETYTPGSMSRHNHLQLLVYLCMLEYLHKNFSNFIYLPMLIIDSADQAMEDTSFEEIYPSLVEVAKSIGVQTIFISKYKPTSVQESDLIDITGGFNPFHQRSEN